MEGEAEGELSEAVDFQNGRIGSRSIGRGRDIGGSGRFSKW